MLNYNNVMHMFTVSMEAIMGYREKSAWCALVTIVIAYSAFFAVIAGAGPGGGPATLRLLALFAAATLGQGTMFLIGTRIIAARGPADARAPIDERDRAVGRRAASIAYYVMMVEMVLVGIIMPFSKSGWEITNAALLAIVIAELVRYGVMVTSYRNGWHG